jgi:hypothetical protein
VVVGLPATSSIGLAKKQKEGCGFMNQIPALVRVFAYLSILTVGMHMAFPEMKV